MTVGQSLSSPLRRLMSLPSLSPYPSAELSHCATNCLLLAAQTIYVCPRWYTPLLEHSPRRRVLDRTAPIRLEPHLTRIVELTRVGVRIDRFGRFPPPVPGGIRTAIRFGVIRPNTCRSDAGAPDVNGRLSSVTRLDGPATPHAGREKALPIVCRVVDMLIFVRRWMYVDTYVFGYDFSDSCVLSSSIPPI